MQIRGASPCTCQSPALRPAPAPPPPSARGWPQHCNRTKVHLMQCMYTSYISHIYFIHTSYILRIGRLMRCMYTSICPSASFEGAIESIFLRLSSSIVRLCLFVSRQVSKDPLVLSWLNLLGLNDKGMFVPGARSLLCHLAPRLVHVHHSGKCITSVCYLYSVAPLTLRKLLMQAGSFRNWRVSLTRGNIYRNTRQSPT